MQYRAFGREWENLLAYFSPFGVLITATSWWCLHWGTLIQANLTYWGCFVEAPSLKLPYFARVIEIASLRLSHWGCYWGCHIKAVILKLPYWGYRVEGLVLRLLYWGNFYEITLWRLPYWGCLIWLLINDYWGSLIEASSLKLPLS